MVVFSVLLNRVCIKQVEMMQHDVVSKANVKLGSTLQLTYLLFKNGL